MKEKIVSETAEIPGINRISRFCRSGKPGSFSTSCRIWKSGSFCRIWKMAMAMLLLFLQTLLVAGTEVWKVGNNLVLTGTAPPGTTELEVRIFSDRNRSISSYHDLSENDPEWKPGKNGNYPMEWTIFYPVVDIELQEVTKATAVFGGDAGTSCTVNGMFHPEIIETNGNRLEFSPEWLLHWENNLYVQPAVSGLDSFYLTVSIPVNGVFRDTIRLLTGSWGGEVAVRMKPGSGSFETFLFKKDKGHPDQGRLSGHAGKGLSRERLLDALEAGLRFTLGSQGLFRPGNGKGLNIFYDLEAETYRRPTWIWAWGPSIGLLLEASEIPEITSRIPADKLTSAAREIGEVSLHYRDTTPASPSFGIVTSRWSENRGTLEENGGYEQYYSIADGQFLAGWGWIPLYEHTGDQRYLDAARELTAATARLMDTFEIIPMDYMVRAGRWKDYALNEQGFGTEGINKLFGADPDPGTRATGEAYMEMLLSKFETPEGLWNRMYRIERQVTEPPSYHTRGTGWAMEGLLAVYQLTGKPDYLHKAEKLAQHLTDSQLEDGSWSYRFMSMEPGEISEKGTALWSLLFYQLFDITGNPDYLAVARKALAWCLDHQYDGPDAHAYGGVVGLSRQSGVIYRGWYPLACTYTSGFFGYAILEELKLQSNEK